MARPALYLHTLVHLRPKQIAYQILYRLVRGRLRRAKAPRCEALALLSFPPKRPCLVAPLTFDFLHLTARFTSWDDTQRGMLWAYNLNYMDFLLQEDLPWDEGAKWVDRFIDDMPHMRVGLDPYPTALRTLNWIKFISLHAAHIDAERRGRWDDALLSQTRLLERRLEYHLLGNHLLEDACALYVAALYFRDTRLHARARRLLLDELDEQVLSDGAHYEQSPMYHCILLDRLLDCYNAALHATSDAAGGPERARIRHHAERMLGHLESIRFADGTLPLLGDSAPDIAPTPQQIFDYAGRLGLTWEAIPLGACGYRHITTPHLEAIVDIGNLTATYQPGHSHADTFTLCLHMDGRPFLVDTGISTYDKTPRREYERGTAAHNTVVVDGKNSSETWGGFRVGRRAKATLLADAPRHIEARHSGGHQRDFRLTDDSLTLTDTVRPGHTAVCHLHLAPGTRLLRLTRDTIETPTALITLSGHDSVETEEAKVAHGYNRFLPSTTIKIAFQGTLTTQIHRK